MDEIREVDKQNIWSAPTSNATLLTMRTLIQLHSYWSSVHSHCIKPASELAECFWQEILSLAQYGSVRNRSSD